VSIKTYHFNDAERVRYGRFPVLDTIVYRWARRIEETLFDQLGVELYAGASVVEELRFSNFFASLKRPRPIYTFALEPMPGKGLLVLDNRFAHLCLNQGTTKEKEALQLTPENQRRMQEVVQAMAADFDASWADVLNVHTRLQKLTTYLFRARILNAYEPCLVAQIHLSGPDASARLIWCFPRVMMESAMEKLVTASVVPTLYQERAEYNRSDPSKLLEETHYGVKVSLGSVNLTHGGKPFGVGSVLPIMNDVGGNAVLHVNEVPMFVGSIGEVQGRMAVKIAGPYADQKAHYKANPGDFHQLSWPTDSE